MEVCESCTTVPLYGWTNGFMLFYLPAEKSLLQKNDSLGRVIP